MTVATDRWTCPSCLRTVVISASEEDTHFCIAAAQLRHAASHAAARRVAVPKPRRGNQ